MELIGCPETSVRNYHSTLRKILEKRRSHLQNYATICGDKVRVS